MKRIKHLLLLLSFASLSIPTLAQYVPEAMELDSDSVVVDSIEGFDMDFKVSLDSLRLLVEQNPQDGKAWLNLAEAYWYQDADTTLFEQALQKCVSLLPAASSDDLERACWLAKVGFSGNKRIELLKTMLQRLPQNVIIKNGLAQAYYEENDYDMAEYYDSINYEYIRTHHAEDYVEALTDAAERVTSVEDSIKISTGMRNYRAWKRIKLAYDISDGNYGTVFLLADSYMKLAAYGNSIYASENEARIKAGLMPIDFTQALVDSAFTVILAEELGNEVDIPLFFFKEGKKLGASTVRAIENYILQKIKSKPQEPQWHYYEGMLLMHCNRTEEAIPHLEAAYEQRPNEDLAFVLIYGYYRMRQWGKSIELVNKLIQEQKGNERDLVESYNLLCKLYGAQGNYEAAIKAVNKCIKIGKKIDWYGLSMAYELRAMTYILQGQGKNAQLNSKALADLQIAFEASEDFYKRQMMAVWYGWLLDQPHKALPARSDSLSLQANWRTFALKIDVTISVANIIAQYFWGDAAQARQDMDEVLANDPNNEYFFEIAGFYALQGDTAKAIEVLRNGIKEGDYWYAGLRDLPWLSSLKGNPEYEDLLK
ncbi:MAG: hypothetical protein HXK22_02910 [Alloprevotella tannerae]|nr:hypothetical protein [Alloprevotella tannerae]